MDLLVGIRTLRERRWLFLGSSLIALAFLIFGPGERALAPQYVSAAKILLTPPTVVAYTDRGGDTPMIQSWFTDETTLRELVGSEELLTRVQARLQLRESWADFRQRVQVQILSRQSRAVTLFQIEVMAARPEVSQQQTTILVEEFVKYVQELSAREFASTRRFLVELVGEANSQLQRAQQAMLKSKSVAVTKDGVDVSARRRIDLEASRSQYSREAESIRAQLAELRASDASMAPPWAVLEQKNSGLDALRDGLAKERAKLDELERTYLPSTEEVLAQRARLKSQQDAYEREVRRAVTSLTRERESALAQAEASLQTVEAEIEKLALAEPTVSDRLQFATRERQLNVWQENYLNLTKRLYEAKVNEQMSKRQGAFSILERPQPGVAVIRPGAKNRPAWQRYVFGVPFCFFFGAAVVFLQEYLNASLRLQPKIEEALDLPVLGSIPKLDKEMIRRWHRLRFPNAELEDGEEASEAPVKS